MFYKKKGIPEVGDIVLCTVKKILFHSVFVELDEYVNREAMIHISEIAPGRIRNLRDYVREGKKLVCKVLKRYPDGKLDLSLRRVPLNSAKRKNEEYRQEQKAEAILEHVGKQLGTDIKGMYEKAGYRIIEEYGGLFPCFQEIAVKGKAVLADMGIEDRFAAAIAEAVTERIKPPEVAITSKLSLQSFAGNGVEVVKALLTDIEQFSKSKGYRLELSYVSAPLYRLEIKASEYKAAEEALKSILDFALKAAKAKECAIELKRDE